MKTTIKYKGNTCNVEMCKGIPRREIPKTYKQVGSFCHQFGNSYNSDLGDLYQNRRGDLYYSIYRDGCFWPYVGKMIFLEN